MFISCVTMANAAFILTVCTILTAVNGDRSAVDLLQDVYHSCVEDLSVDCVKSKALHWISDVSNDQEIKITDDMYIVKKDNPDLTEDPRRISQDIFDKLEDFLQYHDLIIKAPSILKPDGPAGRFISNSFQANDIRVPLAATGRSSKLIKKVIVPFLLGLKFKSAILVPLALALIALKTWKALTLGLLSLVLTGALLLFKLTKPKVVNYEVIHYPQAQHIEHHVEHPVSPGWEHPATYGRNFDRSEMAYRGYLN